MSTFVIWYIFVQFRRTATSFIYSFILIRQFERDTSTSWRHLLPARNSPLPSGEITPPWGLHPQVYIPRYTSPTLFEQQGGFFYVTLQLIRKDDEDKANSLTLPPNATNIWTEGRSEITARLSQLS